MLRTEMIDTADRKAVSEFIQFHYQLYRGTPQWVPPIRDDIRAMLNRQKHPYYEHSDADFFVVKNGADVVGRVAALENKAYNQYHDKRIANIYLLDMVDDAQVADTLFAAVSDWARKRGLDTIVGPKGFSLFDGYGVQVEGHQYRQMMTMMNYNFPYYQTLIEAAGFDKEVDFVSCYLPAEKFSVPEKVGEVARRVAERGKFKVMNFESKRHLLRYARQIGEAYNKTFVKNWEYWPMTEREIKYVVDTVLLVAIPKLIKLISYNDEIVGFLFGFPDISAALQRHNGNVSLRNPIAIADLLLEMRRTKWISLNGVGVLPEFHGRGGNALLYSEMEKTLHTFDYRYGELTQVAETAEQMRKDLITAGGEAYKNHRVYRKTI
jgi:hypothetical protein